MVSDCLPAFRPRPGLVQYSGCQCAICLSDVGSLGLKADVFCLIAVFQEQQNAAGDPAGMLTIHLGMPVHGQHEPPHDHNVLPEFVIDCGAAQHAFPLFQHVNGRISATVQLLWELLQSNLASDMTNSPNAFSVLPACMQSNPPSF